MKPKTKNWTHLYPKFAGKWVAFDKDEETIITAAKTLKTLMKFASAKGYSSPITFKVPLEQLPYVGQYQN